jgi:hypothetical protein
MFGNETPSGPAGRFLSSGRRLAFMRSRTGLGDNQPDPMEYLGNLFDVAILIGVGFLVLAMTGFGLNELLSEESVTIVKNPGTANMEIITKEGQRIDRLKSTSAQAQGTGIPVGTVYRLKDGRMVWVPGESEGAPPGSVPATSGAVPGTVPSGLPGTMPGTNQGMTPSTLPTIP